MSWQYSSHNRSSRFPIWLKAVCCAFVTFHLIINLGFYGPLNYLWFCDVALLTATIALCLENRLLLSMTALSVLGPAIAWSIDFLCFSVTGRYPIGIASYMSDGEVPLQVRFASTFHLWLPPLLLWMMSRVGYDRRALIYQTLFAIALLVICRTMTAAPPPSSNRDVVNINSVYGNSDRAPQTRYPRWACKATAYLPFRNLRITPQTPLSGWVYVTWVVVKFWFGMYLPIHAMACLLFDRRTRQTPARVVSNESIVPSLPR